MKIVPFIFIILFLANCDNQNTASMDNDFSPYPRVREAYAQKGDKVKKMLSKRAIDFDSLNIFIRAFKQEKIVEIWSKNITDEKYQLVTTYDVCKSSGDLGPKRREGDYQVPEGA